jgi:UDP-GlcNAc3NAcA epimerase
MKCLTVVGARPQFVKVAPVSVAMIEAEVDEILLHTGQHYDYEMSQVFFDELGIPSPKYNLEIAGGAHGQMTGRMLEGIERVIIDELPDCVLVYGDTNSTLAGALAAAKLHVPVAHVEAGLRSFNRKMPEEINRVLTDHISTLLLCPSQTAVNHLCSEGITKGVLLVHDVMADAAKHARRIVEDDEGYLPAIDGFDWGSEFNLLTLHRAENTDVLGRLQAIFTALNRSNQPIIFPVHPRTKKIISETGLHLDDHITMVEPFGYLSMAAVTERCSRVLTDSGGLQKEAYWARKPCITLRDETEWVETLEGGANQITGADTERILAALENTGELQFEDGLYGDGNAARRCVSVIKELICG